MAKGIITLIGLVVSLGVIALGTVLVALPVFLQSLSVEGQTATVANTNVVYQAQVDNLRKQQEDIDTINASVATLRAQIPAAGQFDDVFEVIGRAAAAAEVDIVSITAGDQVAFAPHIGPATEAPQVPAQSTDTATDAGIDQTDNGATEAAPTEVPVSGRQQVDFALQVTASGMDQVTTFLDALRGGPRLLSNMTATAVTNGEGSVSVQVSALAYVDEEG